MTSNSELQLADAFVQETNCHLFLTGKAGTGKTTFLHNLRKKTHKRMVVTAPTGVAAINAGGMTLTWLGRRLWCCAEARLLSENSLTIAGRYTYGRCARQVIKILDNWAWISFEYRLTTRNYSSHFHKNALQTS